MRKIALAISDLSIFDPGLSSVHSAYAMVLKPSAILLRFRNRNKVYVICHQAVSQNVHTVFAAILF